MKIIKQNKKHSSGFTLIELMITVAVLGILASIALPSYQEYLQRGRRVDAKAALLDLQLLQEKYRANNPLYATNVGMIGDTSVSPDTHYNITITAPTTLAPSGIAYTATATPTGAQTGDKCGTFTINQDGASPQISPNATQDCWDR